MGYTLLMLAHYLEWQQCVGAEILEVLREEESFNFNNISCLKVVSSHLRSTQSLPLHDMASKEPCGQT